MRLLSCVLLATAGPAMASEPCSVGETRVAAERVIRLDPQARDRVEGRRGALASSREMLLFAIDTRAATGLRIDVEGSGFDPAVELCRQEGGRLVRVAENLDGPRDLDPRLETVVPAGRSFVVVRAESGSGPFTLLVRQTEAPRPIPVRRISVGQTVTGRLRPEPDRSVTVKDRWALQVEGGATYLVAARSDSFDTILWVRDQNADAGGRTYGENDDGWDGLNSILLFSARDSGTRIIEIGDNNGNGGEYRLTVRLLDPSLASLPPR